MSFISKEYIIFFIIVFFLYYSLAKSFKIQNLLILLASYFFYGWFNWKLLGLMLFTTIVAYTCALYIPQSRINNDKYAKWILVIGVGILLGVLGVFKYYNFFVVSLSTLLTKAHIPFNLDTIKIILPIGISFYTFQAISYIVDVYKGKIQPEKNFIDFAAFKAFFPQLVAGPIERADHLLVQFKKSRTLTSLKVKQAIWLLTYGFFIKVVIADNAALIVNYAFIDNQQFGWWVILGTSAFTLQIYTDFLGYSLIAKGSALLLGFELIWNFHFPYWAVSC